MLVGAGRHRAYKMSIPNPLPLEGGSASVPGINQSGMIRRKWSRIPDTAARVTSTTHGEEVHEAKDGMPVALSGATSVSVYALPLTAPEEVDSMEGIDAAEIESFILGPDEQKKRWERCLSNREYCC